MSYIPSCVAEPGQSPMQPKVCNKKVRICGNTSWEGAMRAVNSSGAEWGYTKYRRKNRIHSASLLCWCVPGNVGTDDQNCEKVLILILNFFTLCKMLMSLQLLFFCYPFYALSYIGLPFSHSPLLHKCPFFFSATFYNICFFTLSPPTACFPWPVPPVPISSLCYPSCLVPSPFLHGSFECKAKWLNSPTHRTACSFSVDFSSCKWKQSDEMLDTGLREPTIFHPSYLLKRPSVYLQLHT